MRAKSDPWSRPVARSIAALCLLLCAAGSAAADSPLTIRVVDGSTGLPADARVRVHTSEGWLFTAMDPVLLTHTTSSVGSYVHFTDSLVVEVPDGQCAAWVSRGITSVPEFRIFDVAGPTTQVFTITDWIDPRDDGWYAADPHAHLWHDRGLDYPPILPEDAATAARAEGLDLLYLLENDAAHPGGAVSPPQPGTALVWGEEYRNSFWGHTVWLGLEELVTWSGAGCCGWPQAAWPTLTWTFENHPVGIRILAHPRSTDEPLAPFTEWPGSGFTRERAALALTGSVDGFAVASASNEGGAWAFEQYLSAARLGARWAAVGEGDRALDRFFVTPVGQPRTYAWLGTGWGPETPGLSDAWEAAVAARRCYATTGPVVRTLEVEGVPMGGEYDRGSPGPVAVHLSVVALRPLERVRLHGATGVHWEHLPDPGRTALDTTVTVTIGHDDFVLLDVEADSIQWPELVFAPRAVTSPVWIEAGGPWPAEPSLVRDAVDELEGFFEQALELLGFASVADSLAASEDILGAAARFEAWVDDPPAPFELLSPDDGAQIAAPGAVLSWSPSVSYDGEPVSYRVRVARDEDFLDLVADAVTTDTHYVLDAAGDPSGFHWEVEALEPGEPPTLADGAPRSFYATGGVVAAPPASGPAFRLGTPIVGRARIRISLRMERPLPVELRWVDVRGRSVGAESLGRLPAGTRELDLLPRDRGGRVLARGVYWMVVEGGPHRAVARIVWLR